ncbi:hypothetical protein [Streptomyces xinghaiensis]|uniref:hypothetical protein n=2 Tax=Streptomyces TaxID=1883 RepID=UPI0002EF3DFA|nr:hypothetical protein [Streptomyces xinghaiensis]MZE80921.1 hypothetical protein [Streptomyces sp. SID5475]
MPGKLDDALNFILNQASQEEVHKIFSAGKQRLSTLRTLRAAAVTTGAHVRITEIKPKRYEGLEGQVTETERARTRTYATVLLTEKSTTKLRERGGVIAPDVTRHEVTGIPAACCEVRGASDNRS